MEFLCDSKKNFYFLEMNTRLQVRDYTSRYGYWYPAMLFSIPVPTYTYNKGTASEANLINKLKDSDTVVKKYRYRY